LLDQIDNVGRYIIHVPSWNTRGINCLVLLLLPTESGTFYIVLILSPSIKDLKLKLTNNKGW